MSNRKSKWVCGRCDLTFHIREKITVPSKLRCGNCNLRHIARRQPSNFIRMLATLSDIQEIYPNANDGRL